MKRKSRSLGAYNKPFVAKVNHVEALLYEDHIGPVKLFGTSKHGGLEGFTFVKGQALDIKVTYEESDRISEVTPIIIDEEVVLDENTILKM